MKFSDNTLKSTVKLLIIIASLFTSSVTHAQDVWHWDGSDNSDFDNPANWESGTAPPDGATVYIHDESDHYPIIKNYSSWCTVQRVTVWL